jgi:hypothetical protein
VVAPGARTVNAYCNRVPAWLAGFAGRFPGFAARYLTLDPRSLGLGRIYLGALLMLDLLRRVPDLEVWYTNVGLLPNHTLLWRPGARYQFSFFFPFSWTSEVVVLFALCGVIFFCFLIGWKTRLFHWLSVLCIVSLHDRVIFLENGGDVVLNILAVWTLFLPLGARFSVDALLGSLQTRREANLAEVEDRSLLPREVRPALTLGVLGLLLQIAVIYYFNVVHKGGHTWREGTAVHYALHQDRLVSWLGWKIRPHLTLPLSQALTYSALVVESLGPLLVLNPFHWRVTRRLAVILMAGLHIGFALLLNLGLFSFNMIGFFLLLIPGTDWDRLTRWFRRKPPARVRTVQVDQSNPLCFLIARVLARLDPTHALRFTPASGAPALVVEDQASGRRFEGPAALPPIFAALPFGAPVALLLRVPGLSALLSRMYRWLERRRAEVATGLGLSPLSAPVWAAPEPPPVRRWFTVQGMRLRELAVVVLTIALGSQVLMENRAVPRWLKFGQAEWMRMVVEYPRLFQGWGMFSPNAPMDDTNIVVEATTMSGRKVDPLNERGSRLAPVPANGIVEFLDQDEYFCDYIQRIAGQGAYHPALSEWIQRYHLRTGREEDKLVGFDVYSITDNSPKIGSTQPTDVKKTKMFSWP